ncbi:RNA-binding domain-containing protein [Agrocybe pediades]|nr:RNA-binding domain-containing protein [Agrocybe pediades]
MSSNRTGQRKPYSRPTPRGNSDGQWLHDKAPTGPAKGRIPANPTRNGPALATGPPASVNSRLVVSNLHYDITPKDLISVFGQIGTLVREPLLRYDASGRSTGTAIITFESAMEATRAKKQFDGYLARGQPMSIAYASPPPRAPRQQRRATSVPATTSLLNRIEKVPLSARISAQDDSGIKVPSAPRAFTGPVRSKPARGPRGAPPKGPKKAKTAAELDNELDAFMGDADANAPPTAPAAVPVAATASLQDVDMA